MSTSTGVTFNPVQGRKRGLTRAMLGDRYQEVVTSVPEPPEPLQKLEQYTVERLKDGLEYVDATLRHPQRKISPGGEIGLGVYKDACLKVLDLMDVEDGEITELTPDEKRELELSHLALIRDVERSLKFTACMRITNTASAQELQDEILELQKMAFYCRYGDYFAEVCNQLKDKAEKQRIPGWQALTKYWSDVSKQVESEKEIYNRSKKGETGLQAQMPVTHAIQSTYFALGFDPEDTLHIMHEYGTRNKLLHANLIPIIKNGHFSTLAKRLHDNRANIPLILRSKTTNKAIMERLLETTINLWYEREAMDPGNWQMWTPKPSLKERYKDLNGKSFGKEAEINKQMTKEISKEFRKNLNQSKNEDKLVELFKMIKGGNKLPQKRVASEHYEAEVEQNDKRKKVWGAFMSMYHQARKMADAEKLGEDWLPKEIIKDESL